METSQDTQGSDEATGIPSPDSSNYNNIRTDKMLTDFDIEIAAILVQDAKAERNMKFKRDEKSVKAYKLYRHIALKIILFFCIWGNMFLALLERPGVGGYEIPYWASMLIEIVFLSFFLFRFLHNVYFHDDEKFWRDPKNIVIITSIVVTCIDMICYSIWMEIGPTQFHPVRWSRVLRPLFVINFPEGRQVRKALRSITRTLLDIGHGLILLLASIALFSLMALKLFEGRGLTYPNGLPYFRDFFEIFWELYVLVTTSNSPDVMMPAYNYNRFCAIFFGCFMMVNLYFFMSIVLAIVYHNYKNHLKNEVMKGVYRKRKLLAKAFGILRDPYVSRQSVSKETFHQLMKIIVPDKSDQYIRLIESALDKEDSGYITKAEFLKLADLLTVSVTESKDTMTVFERKYPKCYHSSPSYFTRKVVQHRFFRIGFDFAIAVNTLCIAMNWDQAEWFFLSIFVMEILLKMYADGLVKFFTNMWNVFDFIIVSLALAVMIFEAASGSAEMMEEYTLDFILVTRVLRLVRLLTNNKRFLVILTTIVNIGPSIVTYCCVFFAIYYIFAIIGMEAFGGRLSSNATDWCGNPALNNSDFHRLSYCSNNFNDFTRAIVTLYELMVVNQWHVIANGFVLMTNKAARLYFFSFHVVGVVVLLNIITAFVIEAFMLEYTVSKHNHLREALMDTMKKLGFIKDPAQLSIVEVRADSSMPDGFVTSTDAQQSNIESAIGFEEEKTYFTLNDHGFKKIEIVLQEMFQEQIDPTEQGPDKDSDGSDLEDEELKAFGYNRM